MGGAGADLCVSRSYSSVSSGCEVFSCFLALRKEGSHLFDSAFGLPYKGRHGIACSLGPPDPPDSALGPPDPPDSALSWQTANLVPRPATFSAFV